MLLPWLLLLLGLTAGCLGEFCTNECRAGSRDHWCGQRRTDLHGNVVECRQKTRYNRECVDSCSTKGEKYFWCWQELHNVGNSGYWDYCAVQTFTVKGRLCKDSCRLNTGWGGSYWWCNDGSSNKWDYCSPPGEVAPVQHTTTGRKCLGLCSRRTSFFGADEWKCRVSERWSTKREGREVTEGEVEGRSRYGQASLLRPTLSADTSSASLSIGNNHNSFDDDDNERPRDVRFETCSPSHYVTSTNLPCKDECLSRGERYFWCHADTRWGWGRCSPQPALSEARTTGSAWGGGGQHSDHGGRECAGICDRLGEGYFWCEVKKSKSGYSQSGWWDHCHPQY